MDIILNISYNSLVVFLQLNMIYYLKYQIKSLKNNDLYY